MVKKKRMKKVPKKRIVGKPPRFVRASKRKINLVLRNLILFVVMSLISFVLYKYILSNELLITLFSLLAMIFGFVAVAFLIVLLVFLILRTMKK